MPETPAPTRLTCLLALLLGACAANPGPAASPPAPAQPPSPEVAARLGEMTAPDRPLRVLFDWVLTERDARFTGKGVARVQSPYHARLDLFGPRGEGYLAAALVDMQLRLPPRAASANLPVPPPPLFWTALGVFRPPVDGVLMETTQDGDRLRLRYQEGESSWTFEFAGDVLLSAEWMHPRTGRQTVEITPGQGTAPRQVVYRDWPAFRQLTLTLTQALNVEPFSPDTWTPGVF